MPVRLAALAERFVFKDPNTTLINIRQLAETLAKSVAASVGLNCGYDETFLGVRQNTLRKWADEDRIPVRVNPAHGYRLFDREELEIFLSKIDIPSKVRKNRKG